MADVERMFPNNISDVQMVDEESGLRLFRAVLTPFDKLITLREAYKFLVRENALVTAGLIHAMRIMEPDYAKCASLCYEAFYHFIEESHKNPNNPQNRENYMPRANVPEGWERACLYSGAIMADRGDEVKLLSGKVLQLTRERTEKEIHTCPWDICGTITCRANFGAGMAFLPAFAEPDKVWLTTPEVKGAGCVHCRLILENQEKWPDPGPYQKLLDTPWEFCEPHLPYAAVTPENECIKEVPLLTTGFYENGYGAKWTAGEMFKECGAFPELGQIGIFGAMRQIEPDDKKRAHIIREVFKSSGKFAFSHPAQIDGVRQWLGVPSDVNDGRVLAGYVSTFLQISNIPWKFTEYSDERVVIEMDKSSFTHYGLYMDYIPAFEGLWFGMAKTLINNQWYPTINTDDDKYLTLTIEKKVDFYQ